MKSEIIRENREAITEVLVDRYEKVLRAAGRIQYKVYIWENGEIECLQGPQGDNTRLISRNNWLDLHYITTVEAPFFDPWDFSFETAPEDEKAREAAENEIIAELVNTFKDCAPEILADVIREAAENDD